MTAPGGMRTSGGMTTTPGTRARGRPLHIVVLASWLRFPCGMATSSRVRQMARVLQSGGARVRVICLQVSERPPVIENTEVRGRYQGVPFEYTAGTTVRSSSFVRRRLVATRGW